jgi:hypothetical protein
LFKASQIRKQVAQRCSIPDIAALAAACGAARGYITRRMRPQWELARGKFTLTSPRVNHNRRTLSSLDRLIGSAASRSFAASLSSRASHAVNAPQIAYGGEPTQTATNGVFEALWTGPQDAPLSLRNCA